MGRQLAGGDGGGSAALQPTDVDDPTHYASVVSCQWACPARTDVPGYLRLIAQGRYDDAYLANRATNVFPGVLGRVCDRPCEPACRRVRVSGEPVAICRLKRFAADLRSDRCRRSPAAMPEGNGRRVVAVGCGPASLAVANDLLPLGYEVHLLERAAEPGGLMRSSIPAFRLPAPVLDEEIEAILRMGAEVRFETPVTSLARLVDAGYDAVFLGTGAPRGSDLDLPGRRVGDAAAKVHVGLDWLAEVAFGHRDRIGERVVVVGVGNTAMDCARTARRLGGREVTVIGRRPRPFFKAAAWELEEAEAEGVVILGEHAPRGFVVERGRLRAVVVDLLSWDDAAVASRVVGTRVLPVDEVLLAVGQEPAFDWIEQDLGIAFDGRGLPVVDPATMASTRPGVFVGGDAAFGPRNIVSAVADAHVAARAIDRHCRGLPPEAHPEGDLHLVSRRMGLQQWAYANDVSLAGRQQMPEAPLERRFDRLEVEVELGYSPAQAAREAGRCLNCDIQTVFDHGRCIECGACVDVCPAECLTIAEAGTAEEVCARLTRPPADPGQPLYVSRPLPQTGRLMVKDENLCLHCGLCAERCPVAAWDMAKVALPELAVDLLAHLGVPTSPWRTGAVQ